MVNLGSETRKRDLYQQGQDAAALLWRHWKDRPEIEDPREPEFVRGAFNEIIRRLKESDDVDKEIREHSEAAAEQLTKPSRTIYEVLQNADDLGASSLRASLRQSGRGELLFAHDGSQVELSDVIAMTLSFLSSKRGDVTSKGRFGIGLKTLNQLGSTLKVHCAPYHFEIERGMLKPINPIDGVRGLFDASRSETLLSVALDGEFGVDSVQSWIREIEASQLLFLDSICKVSLIDARTGRQEWHVELERRSLQNAKIELRPGASFEAARVAFSDPARKGRSWTRYLIEYPVPRGYKRAHKATGATTPLSVAVSESGDLGILAAGMPLDVPWSLPLSLNAQFDPDLARLNLRETAWNTWLLKRLGELVSGVALHRFNDEPEKAWHAVPLRSEVVGTGSWPAKQFSELIDMVHDRMRSKVRLNIGRRKVRLSEISFTSGGTAGILSVVDQERLAPQKIPLPKKYCGTKGRWHMVLDDLGISRRLGIHDALKLLDLPDDELGARPVHWFAKLADVAITAGEEDSFTNRRSVIAEDGSRHSPKGDTLLVRETEEVSISARLGLEKRLAPDYLSERTSERVKEWIEKNISTSASENPAAILEALSRRSERKPLHLDDCSLVLLRDALQKVEAVLSQSLATAIGKVTTVDGFRFSKGKKIACKVRPSSSYLPTSIAKNTGGWAVAAKSTEDLFWIDPKYVEVLRSEQVKHFNARRFFLLLGAKAGPRLISRADERFSLYQSGIPDAQSDALRKLDNWYNIKRLQSDYVAPDLDKVVADIVRQRVDEKRSHRARALFDTLARDWEELSEYAEANAFFHYYTWRHAGRIPSTWIAKLASEPWLSSKAKTKVAPRDIAIESATTRLTRGKKRNGFVSELTEADSASRVIGALEIKGTPPASELIAELKALKSKYEKEAKFDNARPLYEALAALIENERAHDIGDVPAIDLRHIFENDGLLLTDLGWFPPSRVFRGRAIFRRRRAFVTEQRTLAPLWQLLKILPPNLKDCLEIMEELVEESQNPSEDMKALVIDTLRAIAENPEVIKGRLASRLAKLPLWTSNGWMTDRPVYAVADETLGRALGDKVPLWQPGCALKSLGDLPGSLNVEVLTETDFSLSPKQDIQPADETTQNTFKAAVATLKTEIARTDQDLWNAIIWSRLEETELLQVNPLRTETTVRQKKILVLQALYMEARRRLYYAEVDELGSPDIGERILARFISGVTTERLGYLWSWAWSQAEERGGPAQVLELAHNTAESEDDALQSLKAGGKSAKGKHLFAGGALGKIEKDRKKRRQLLPKPRRLKTFDGASIADVRIVEAGHKAKKLNPQRKPLILDPTHFPRPKKEDSTHAPIREWSELEKERLGFEVLAAALKNIDNVELEDFSALQGIGADSIDSLKRYFELKVFAGDATDEVRFEPSEFERAVKTGKQYFLAVISGLEEGKDTAVRIFSDPVRTLPWRRHSRIKLGGILSQSSHSLLLTIATPD